MILEVLIDESIDGNYGGIDSQLLSHESEELFCQLNLLVLKSIINEFIEEYVIRS
jgi:hypothetical protein